MATALVVAALGMRRGSTVESAGAEPDADSVASAPTGAGGSKWHRVRLRPARLAS
jgi:hypothetical protein